MNKKKLYIALLSLLSLSSSDAFAQKRSYEGTNKMNTWSITGYGGITRFFGDLNDNQDLTGVYGLSINKQLTPLFGVQLTGYNGWLNGSKNGVQGFEWGGQTVNSYSANFSSKAFIQASLDGTVNLSRLVFGPNRMRHWKIDAHAGFGAMYFNTELNATNLATGQRTQLFSNTEASSTTGGSWESEGSHYTREWVVPVGLAIHYEVSPRIDIGVDFVFNHINSEKIDLTVGDRTDYAQQSHLWLFHKGDSKQDKWGTAMVALTYKLGKSAVKSKKGEYDASSGRYHLRWTDPKNLIPKVYNPTLSDADSIAKANMPAPVDPRLYTDSDGDGVADLFDKEANTPAGSIVSGGGVALDIDRIIRDAIKNNLPKDECEALFSNIEFDTDKSIIRPASKETLDKVIQLLNLRSNCRIVLVGHTDARASDAYNVALSRRRVDAAKRYLVRAGLKDASRITVEYYGELRPIAENVTVEGLQSNRRVEIKILPPSDLRSNYPAGFRP